MLFFRKTFWILISLWPSISMAAQDDISTLYDMVRESRLQQQQLNATREQTFLTEQRQQQQRVNELKKALAEAQNSYKNQLKQVEANRQQITMLQTQLNERTHSLKDLFSAWKQTSRETLENQKNSLLSSQAKQVINQLESMIDKKELPSSSDLLSLQSILQQDITGTGEVTQFIESVTQSSGRTTETSIQRIGPFTATANGAFLVFNSEDQSLHVAPRQPASQYLNHINESVYLSGDAGEHMTAVIDPSRGVVLHRLALEPTLLERIKQGGVIGYIIIFLGIAGLLLACFRWADIGLLRFRINQQLKQPEKINSNNPLGRILAVYHDNPQDHVDSLEVKLQEAVLQEVPRLDRGLGTVKLLAAVAPLLGLLGTVVGMINTFQTITLVGSTDPKLMAGGISQALVTTVLGLTVTVPLLFSHSFVSSRVRMLMVLLSQQSLGIIAQSIEAQPVEAQTAKAQPSKSADGNHV